MNEKLLVIQVAALSHEFELEGLKSSPMESVFPALTCTVQASFRTAAPPADHGMVANGLFYKNLNRPMFWEQSAGLVQGPRIWENFRKRGKRVGMLFWQQSLGENVDISLSPAPIHKHHGGMIQGCYSQPADLYPRLCKHIRRPFKLKQYWGPTASWKVGEWIVAATEFILKDKQLAPDLCFTYLPTLDYDLQRNDPDTSRAAALARQRADVQLTALIRSSRENGYDVVLYGDYRIGPVNDAVLPNRVLRQAGMLAMRDVNGMMYPDFHTSRAFAMVDHEIAHVYIPDENEIPVVKALFAGTAGIDDILDQDGQAEKRIDHENSGQLMLVAEAGKWLAYPWWTEQYEAPEFAGHVDIHNKPGYDPCELFFGWPPGSVSRNVKRIRGSHGRTGIGREVTWAASFPMREKPKNLIELSSAVQQRLDQGA